MPELPEVQTIVSDLNKKIIGDTIIDFWSDHKKSIKNKTLENFRQEIKNRKIINARRIGKNIFIDLSGDKTLYMHLKMTGHLLVKPQIPIPPRWDKFQNFPHPPTPSPDGRGRGEGVKSYFDDRVNQYIHHIFYLKTGKTLEFSDLRKFAKIVLDDTRKINELKEIKALGADALEEKFTLEKFEEILKKRKNTPIGIVLMEQERISGIGNIYRSEILFEAGILLQRKSGSISAKERTKIYNSIKKVLEKAIKLRGTSDSDYRDTAGAPGNFQKALKVYRKDGAKCKKCGTIIKRIKMGQRSAFYCPNCQK
ncbi:MAG: bifunctional DNA-formamidopyrimidine glycosylase/DNA-(apurinic or apyrimidinic site) lyase [bacterium]|nr:bifunctional DNA-formamidopyrimidine glycosylase/DNA-(apurinic or apyrimidinic site) lyase [bacterium]